MIKLINISKKISGLSLLVLLSSSLYAQKKKEVKPKKFVSTVHMSGSSDFVYFALSEKSKTTVELVGPGKLTVYNRVRLEDNKRVSLPYYLKYTLDKKKVSTKKIGPKAVSKKIFYKSKKLVGKPSKADKEIINIPPGKHTISFYKYKTKQKAHVRFEYLQTEKQQWQELVGSELKKVTLQYLATKKKNSYARINNNEAFRFSTTEDNTKVRVYLRADFTYKMHTDNVIRLVLKSGSETKTYKLTCKKSKKVENLTDRKLIPGKLEKIYIDIPLKKGNNQYELFLKDDEKSALVRVFVNKPKEEISLKTASK
ncbi:MAG: hypothetical protein HRT69_03745 [Flavobacteriaceae bacterium]|nr:hypothetical protein [Flavobacteriaceae bacterium]